MRVLVTGDRGYIGQVLVPMFQAAGHDVVGLDACWYDGCDFGPAVTGYEQRVGDVRDLVAADLEGFDAVVHLAAISNDPIGHLNPGATYSVNAHGAEIAARAAKAAGVQRFIFASSCSLYGAAGDAPVDEESPFQPRDPLRREQGDGRARPVGPRGRRLQPHLHAQRDGLRLLAATARRHRRQQPHRHGADARRGAAPVRRQPVAAAGPRGRHLRRRPRRHGGAPRGRPRPGLQRRPGRGRRPDPHRRNCWSPSTPGARSPSPRGPAPTPATTG